MSWHNISLLLLFVVAILPGSVAFAPQKHFPSMSPRLDVDNPTSPTCKGDAAFALCYKDVLDTKGLRRSHHYVPRWWCSRPMSPLWAAAAPEKDNQYQGHADKEGIMSNGNSHDRVPTTAASNGGVGGYNPAEKLGLEREAAIVGDPQVAQPESMNITMVLTELQAIQSQGPKKYCILGTRHCSFLHQQIVEMLYVFYFLLLLLKTVSFEKR